MLHAEVAAGALADAGLSHADVDGYFCAGDAPGMGPLSMVDYLNLRPRHIDSTDIGGSSYLMLVGHAAEAIASGRCNNERVCDVRDAPHAPVRHHVRAAGLDQGGGIPPRPA
jgi:acetyl-CoA C-acetyltransferase